MAEPKVADRAESHRRGGGRQAGSDPVPVVGDAGLVVDQGDEGDVDVGEAAQFLQAGGGGHVEGGLVGRAQHPGQPPGHALEAGVGVRSGGGAVVQVVTQVHRSPRAAALRRWAPDPARSLGSRAGGRQGEGENWGSQGAEAVRSASVMADRCSQGRVPATGSASMACRTRPRSPEGGLHGQFLGGDDPPEVLGGGAGRGGVPGPDAVAVDGAHALHHHAGREVGDLAGVGQVDRERARRVGDDGVDERGHQFARGPPREGTAGFEFGGPDAVVDLVLGVAGQAVVVDAPGAALIGGGA